MSITIFILRILYIIEVRIGLKRSVKNRMIDREMLQI